MKYFFVSLGTSFKSSANVRPKHSKCFGFGVVSICRCLIWGAWKKAWFKGWIFSLISVPKDHVHLYVQYVCLCIELSERVTLVSAVNVPSPVEWHPNPRLQILSFGGRWARAHRLVWPPWCRAAPGHLLGQSFSHSEETASSMWVSSVWAKIFLLLQIPPGLVSPNCSSQAFRFFSLLDLFLKPFFPYNI